jgi:hypothetical protein
MRYHDQKIYRSFEEFEREELRQMESVAASVDEMIHSAFGELDFEADTAPRRARSWAQDEE